MNANNIPAALRERRQWIVWNMQIRDGKEAKVPLAKSNDPETWTSFDEAMSRQVNEKLSGIGFVFSADDPFCGIDLDGARDPETGKVSDWAREVIVKFGSYAEVSPSKAGVKIFCIGRNPFETGRKQLLDVDAIGDKPPAIEIYDRVRYFAVTGLRLAGMNDLRQADAELQWLKHKFWYDEPATPAQPAEFRGDAAIRNRASKYLEKMEPSISGAKGHDKLFAAACVLVIGFDLPADEALSLLRDFNTRCQPAWSEKELAHKVSQAMKRPEQRGYLRNTAPANWHRVRVPKYECPPMPKTIMLADAATAYYTSIKNGGRELIELGLPEIDYCLGGGAEPGEMVIMAGRPSHGKSACALQMVHHWGSNGLPSAYVSEEMPPLMLGRRTIQFHADLPQEYWTDPVSNIESLIEDYRASHSPCQVIEACGTSQNAAEAIRRAVSENGIRCAVVDYAQLLRSPGKGMYEQVTNTSIVLRQLATELKLVLVVLCHLSRDIEHRRGKFKPQMSDLKNSGQLEQDADVILFLHWPHMMNKEEPRDIYHVHVLKNRNRAIMSDDVTCRFIPERQKVIESKPEYSRSYSDTTT